MFVRNTLHLIKINIKYEQRNKKYKIEKKWSIKPFIINAINDINK